MNVNDFLLNYSTVDGKLGGLQGEPTMNSVVLSTQVHSLSTHCVSARLCSGMTLWDHKLCECPGSYTHQPSIMF